MRKRFLVLVMALSVSCSPGVVHAADRQYLSPDPGSDTAQGIAPSGFTVEEGLTVPTDKPTDYSGILISLPIRSDLELDSSKTEYGVEDYVEIEGELSNTKYITATATAEYDSPDGKVKKTPAVNYEDSDFKWSASQIFKAIDTDDYRPFSVSIPAEEVQDYGGTWNGHIDFTFNIEDIGFTTASAYTYPDGTSSGNYIVGCNASASSDIDSGKYILSITFDRPVRRVSLGSNMSYIAGNNTDTLQLDVSSYFEDSSIFYFDDLKVSPTEDTSSLNILNTELVIEPSFK